VSSGVQKINDNPFLRVIFAIVVGAVIASFISSVKPIWLLLVLSGFLAFMPTFLVKDTQLYWLILFIFALQFDVKKYLIDGLKVLEDLHIDYFQFIFVPEIRLSDLVLIILLVLWVHTLIFHEKKFKFPRVGWFAIGFLVWSGLSMFKAPHIYLSFIELLRQCKFFLIYLYAVNNIDSKRLVKSILVALLMALTLQGTVTLVRYKLQYFEPFFGQSFGRSDYISTAMRQLVINPSVGELKASFGTFASGAITGQFLLLLLPIALMCCYKNPTFSRRWIFFPMFVVGFLGMYVTYSKSCLIAFIVEVILCFYFSLQQRHISKIAALILFCFVALAAPILFHKLNDYMDRKNENVSIRFEQYKIASSIILTNPLLGVGLNNSTGSQGTYREQSYSPIDPISQASDSPIHSFFLTLLTEIGIAGFLSYLIFLIYTCREAWRLSRSARDPEIAFFATILLVAIMGLASGILANPLFEDAIQTLLWLYAGIIIAFTREGASHEQRDGSVESPRLPPKCGPRRECGIYGITTGPDSGEFRPPGLGPGEWKGQTRLGH
jgi:O-antigen ligase